MCLINDKLILIDTGGICQVQAHLSMVGLADHYRNISNKGALPNKCTIHFHKRNSKVVLFHINGHDFFDAGQPPKTVNPKLVGFLNP